MLLGVSMVETMRKPSSLWMGKAFKVRLKYTERLTQILASVLESKDKMGPDRRSLLSSGCGGAHLYPQHSGGKGRWIFEFEVSLVSMENSRLARDT